MNAFPLCENCVFADVKLTEEPCYECHVAFMRDRTKPNFKSARPFTNADKIRAMTDEELADLFDTWVRDCDCNDVPCREYCLPNRYDCVKNWLDWLKQEVTD